VYICQCGVPSLCDLERLEREREREGGRTEGLLELLEVVSIGSRCQEHVLRFRGKSSPPTTIPRVRSTVPASPLSLSPSDSLPRARARSA